MSKKILAFILTVAMVCSLCVPALAEDTQGVTFADAKGNWAESSINRWAAAGIVTGDTNGNVNPGQFLTRAELATILVRFLGLTDKAPADTFSDVAADAWYADAVLKCAAAGIMQGWAGKADPDAAITREQAITMVGRALGVKAQAGQNLSKFEDAAQVSDYATEYMAPLTAMGILSGIEDGSKVAPQANIDRASALALLDKAIAAYVTAPGTVKAEDANKFVIVNATAGDVTVSGTAAGVLVTNGNKANVKLNNMTADTVKVDSAVAVDVSNGSKLGSMDVNAPASVTVDRTSKVNSVDTTDAPNANVSNNQTSGGSSGGGGGGGSVTGKTYAVAVDTKIVNGTVSVSTKNARVGATVTVTAKANDGYVVSDDTVTVTAKDGSAVAVTKGSNGKFTFKMPAQDVTVTATFKKDTTTPVEPDKTYTVTVDTTVGGTVTADKAEAKAGETVTLTVAPATGYELEAIAAGSLSLTKVSDTKYTFVMPAANVTVKASFKAKAVVDENSPVLDFATQDVADNANKPATKIGIFTIVWGDKGKVAAGAVDAFTGDTTGYKGVNYFHPGGASKKDSRIIQFAIEEPSVVKIWFKTGKSGADKTPVARNVALYKGATAEGTAVFETTNTADDEDKAFFVSTELTDAATYTLATTGNTCFIYKVEVAKKGSTPVEPDKTYTVTDATAVDANGALEISKTADLKKGDTVTITVKPANGYELDKLTVDGTAVAVTDNAYTLTIDEANVTVAATFKAVTPAARTEWKWAAGETLEVTQATTAFQDLTLSQVKGQNEGGGQIGLLSMGTGATIGVPVTGKCNVTVKFNYAVNATLGTAEDSIPVSGGSQTATYHYGATAAGTVTIAATGNTYVEQINIEAYTAPEAMLVLGANTATIDLKTTTTAEVTAEVKYGTADNKIVYTIADDTVVSAVYADGKFTFTGLKAGETTVTVTVSGTSLSQTITVTVLPASIGQMEQNSYTFYNYGSTNVAGLEWSGFEATVSSDHGPKSTSADATLKLHLGDDLKGASSVKVTVVTCQYGAKAGATVNGTTVTQVTDESMDGKCKTAAFYAEVTVSVTDGVAVLTFSNNTYVHSIAVAGIV